MVRICKKVIGEKSNINVIRRDIRINEARKSISRSHGRARDMEVTKVKVLQKHYPTGLVMRQFWRLAEIH